MNKFKDQTIVGIVTCNRKDFFEKAIASIDRDAVKKIFVVVAGDDYGSYPEDVTVLKCKRNPTVVGIAKNILWREMFQSGEEFIFTMEDDIVITDNSVFQKYIETAMDSGIWGQLSYGTHGGVAGGAVKPDGSANKRATVRFTKHEVDLYYNSFAAFTFTHRNIIKHMGYHDERYLNAAEHIDYYQRIAQKGLGLPMYAFPDIKDSYLYISDIESNHENSVIRNNPEFLKNFQYSWSLFKNKFGQFPTHMENPTNETVLGIMETLEANYAKKDLI